jgi:hypothetical protein
METAVQKCVDTAVQKYECIDAPVQNYVETSARNCVDSQIQNYVSIATRIQKKTPRNNQNF